MSRNLTPAQRRRFAAIDHGFRLVLETVEQLERGGTFTDDRAELGDQTGARATESFNRHCRAALGLGSSGGGGYKGNHGLPDGAQPTKEWAKISVRANNLIRYGDQRGPEHLREELT